MMIETVLYVALALAETAIQPELTPDPPPAACYDDAEGPTCYPIDLQEKTYGR